MVMKKPTLATLKSFIRKNEANLMIRCDRSFDGMTDCVEMSENPQFRSLVKLNNDSQSEHSLGFGHGSGVWLVGGSRDYIKSYSENGMTGFEVYNCCGSFVLAVAA
jgi:hypothetical protein